MSGLAEALARVQARLPHIQKTKTATVRSDKGNYSYNYADLGDIAPAIHPLLAEQGLAWITKPTLDTDGRFVLAYTLSHAESGESETGVYPLPDPTKVTAQQVGSAITYARRYTLCCVTGIVPDEDDDARAAGDVKASVRRPKPAEKRAERGAVSPDEDPFAAPEWATGFRTRLRMAMTGDALEDRWKELQAAVSNGELSPEWGQTLKGEIGARKAHLAAAEAQPAAARA
jgi:hypothetical protein